MADLQRTLGDSIREAERDASRMFEAVIALVVDNRDPEGLGRVRLRFPTLPGQDASTWALVSGLGAGSDRGWWFLPEIDDEVLVVFEQGDVGRPVVLGSLFNGVDRPPAGGGRGQVMRSRGGSQIAVDDDGGTITIEDQGRLGRIVVDGAGTLTIEAPDGDVELQATAGELRVEARDVELTASDRLLVHADGPITIGARGSAQIEAGSISVSASRLDLNP